MTANITQHVTPRHRYSLHSQRGSISPTTATITLGITVIMGIALLSFLYLGQVQDTASQGTDIQALEERILELREHQRSLELESAQLRSIQTIEENIKELNLVATDQVSYLAPAYNQVAAHTQ